MQPSPHRRRALRGVTLFEVLIVVALLALISAGVAVGITKTVPETKAKLTKASARVVRNGVKAWWAEHDASECPGVADLVDSGTLDRDNAGRDAWGEPWQIVCERGDVTVVSRGPDRRPGTDDDIRVPPT